MEKLIDHGQGMEAAMEAHRKKGLERIRLELEYMAADGRHGDIALVQAYVKHLLEAKNEG